MNRELEMFENFVNSYDMNNPKIKLKYEHTKRVVQRAKEISESINLDEKETNRALVCALFHDLGRFPQVTEYNTFIDELSFDHGDKSYEILNEWNYDDDIVKKAVKYHNKREVPNFDELTNMHCKIVRDADKIDIMLSFINSPIDNNYDVDEETMNTIKVHKLLDNRSKMNEFLYGLRYLAYIFDINYKKTMEILLEHNVIDKKLNLLRCDRNKEQIDFIEKELKEYIKERFDIIC